MISFCDFLLDIFHLLFGYRNFLLHFCSIHCAHSCIVSNSFSRISSNAACAILRWIVTAANFQPRTRQTTDSLFTADEYCLTIIFETLPSKPVVMCVLSFDFEILCWFRASLFYGCKLDLDVKVFGKHTKYWCCWRKVKRLLAAGANVDARISGWLFRGSTPLIVAAFHNHFDVLRLLLDRGADIEARDNEGYGNENTLMCVPIDCRAGGRRCSKLCVMDP